MFIFGADDGEVYMRLGSPDRRRPDACEEIGKPCHHVGRVIQIDGLVHDNSVIFKLKVFSKVHKSKY